MSISLLNLIVSSPVLVKLLILEISGGILSAFLISCLENQSNVARNKVYSSMSSSD